ncbi:sulfite exporter TauE/SafE family protein [Ensifer adhaerens]|uniref:Probable membrane transporter protein n=1 Tax=Ensifer adhaerens TaxID=106592 RepID=A0A9Q9DEE2_ENSAD|nr:sulfite exporter TauE/SafE family protein [Ensifer adhaerens]USJ28614.1 sulfite exporter TauE/SafE family protein [Ensifer adhaerens]
MQRDKPQLLEPAALHGSAIHFPRNPRHRRGRRTGAAYRFAASPTVECATVLLSFSDLLKGRTENRQTASFVPQATMILLAGSRSRCAQNALQVYRVVRPVATRFGAGWAVRLRSETLYKIIACLLVAIAIVLLFGHGLTAGQPLFSGTVQMIAGVIAGFGIGIVASLLGVAGGELLIPTLVLLFGADIKLAGSLSLTVSLPTMVVAFMRYSRDQSFAALGRNRTFLIVMATGSVAGTFIGGRLLGFVPDAVLLPALAGILLISAWKVCGHR